MNTNYKRKRLHIMMLDAFRLSPQFYKRPKAETKCIAWETYANSEAVFAHIKGVASQTIRIISDIIFVS
jgi:hypothetical protein